MKYSLDYVQSKMHFVSIVFPVTDTFFRAKNSLFSHSLKRNFDVFNFRRLQNIHNTLS